MKFKIDQSLIIAPSNPFERSSSSIRYCAYTGRSMHPTLFEADLLEIEQASRISVGDVILFVSGKNLVVHRVVGIASNGISTRGDNNNDDDRGLVASENIVGIVAGAWSGQRRRRIYGGRIGQTYQHFLCGQRRLYRIFRSSLAHSYRAASRLGLSRLVMLFCRPRIVQFNRNGDIGISLMLGGNIIGHYCQSGNCWQIHPPFRLFVDESVLPMPLIDLSRQEEGEAILLCKEMKVE
jgi:Peptidase S24-like.